MKRADIEKITAPPSIAAIAAEVARGSRYQLAERALRSLRERRSKLVEDMRALVAQRDGSPAVRSQAEREITALQSEVSAVEDEIKPARLAFAPLRAEYATKVAAALDPFARDAAARALDAIANLADAWRVVAEINAEVRRAGGNDSLPNLPWLGDVEAASRRLLDR
jgi:hypothetical protein